MVEYIPVMVKYTNMSRWSDTSGPIDPPIAPPGDTLEFRVAALEHDIEQLRQMLAPQIKITDTWIGEM